MNLAPEKRLDMSLDDVIKANKKAAKEAAGKKDKKGGNVAGGKKKGGKGGPLKAPGTPGSAPGSVKKLKKLKLKKLGGGGVSSPAGGASIASKDKSLKSIGMAKVKRAAKVNQKRGLNTSGQASKKDLLKAGGGGNGKPKKIGSPVLPGPGLKISFKPSELGKTTEKSVANQIKAVLAKSTPNPNRPPSHNSNKQAQGAKGGRSVKQGR